MIRGIISVNNQGDVLALNLADFMETGIAITSIDGLGPVTADISTVDIVTFDGAIFNSARAQTRNIVLNFQLVGMDVEALRHTIYKAFPLKQPVEFFVQTDYRFGQTTGYVEKVEPDIFSSGETIQVSLICPDSYFKDASEAGNTVTDFFGIDPMFEFPFSNESLTEKLIIFGNIRSSFEETITYNGEVETGFTITIHATSTVSNNIIITNLNTRGQMVIDMEKLKELTGSYLGPSDDIIISTVKGYKSATLLRSGKQTNILNCLGRDTEWFQLHAGDNRFGYQVADQGSVLALEFSISVQNLFVGV